MSNYYGEEVAVAGVLGMQEALEDLRLSKGEPCASRRGCPVKFPAKPFPAFCVHWSQMSPKLYPVE